MDRRQSVSKVARRTDFGVGKTDPVMKIMVRRVRGCDVGHRAGSTEWVDELGILIYDCFDRSNLYIDLPDSRRAAFFMHPPRLRRGTSLRATEGYSRLKVRCLSTQNQ